MNCEGNEKLRHDIADLYDDVAALEEKFRRLEMKYRLNNNLVESMAGQIVGDAGRHRPLARQENGHEF
ncbi:hypothetical protein [Entomohabitans teleogrylli]|uniref:hypothetical protein n=1 Tax=Entomohabitans teleogrylli TaxID=1384589 RepID=UPI00073D5945|nr:hypothetical protein [Entomohabitans teleogrylli]